MCMSAPKIEAPPPPAQMQAMQQPRDVSQTIGKNNMRRRGMWAALMTPGGAQGLLTPPNVTGTSGGITGG